MFLHVSCCDNVNADCLHIRHLLVCFADIYILSITKHPSVLDIAWCINSHVVFKTNCAYRFTLPWFFKELSTQIKDNGGNRHINYIVKNLKDHSIFWYKDVINLCTCKVFFPCRMLYWQRFNVKITRLWLWFLPNSRPCLTHLSECWDTIFMIKQIAACLSMLRYLGK